LCGQDVERAFRQVTFLIGSEEAPRSGDLKTAELLGKRVAELARKLGGR